MSALTEQGVRDAIPLLRVLGALLLCGVPKSLFTGPQTASPVFTRAEHMIPMRDGVRLYTQVFTPTQATERLPILLSRTPYGTSDMTSEGLAGAGKELVGGGYIHG